MATQDLQQMIDRLEAFKRSPGHSDPERDLLALKAGMAARRLRARGKTYPVDSDLLRAIDAHEGA